MIVGVLVFVVAFNTLERVPSPALLYAQTLNLYVVPAVNPDNVDRIERMVNAFNSKKLENLWETDAFYNYKSKYSYEGEGSLREKISKMKAKAGIIDEHKNAVPNKKVKDMSVDLLADKMKFIEKRVYLFRENSSMVSREQEDKIRISAYKDFKAQSNG